MCECMCACVHACIHGCICGFVHACMFLHLKCVEENNVHHVQAIRFTFVVFITAVIRSPVFVNSL